MDDQLEQQIKAQAILRCVIGGAAMLAPGLSLRGWLGPDSNRPGARVLAMMLGGRDIALGVGTILALKHDAPVRGWLEAGAMADTVDFVANLIGSRHLPRARVLGAAASAIGSAAFGRRLVSQLPSA